VATPTGVLWDRDLHTGAKHQLLRHYLEAWFLILTQSTWGAEGTTYVDAFAGPGEYKDGSIGSPIIALRAANLPQVTETGNPVHLLLIEEHQGRFEHLQALLSNETMHNDHCTWTAKKGSCEAVLTPALDALGAWSGPMFVNFDGWGVDTPFHLVQSVGGGGDKPHEVLVTFEAQWFTRFATVQDQGAGDSVFGDTNWRHVADLASAGEKRSFLIEEYRARLRHAGFAYSSVFELVDERGHELLLVFGTSEEYGIDKMKRAMWNVDPIRGSRFRDPRDPNQAAFELSLTDPDLRLLKEQILGRLEQGPATLSELKRFALLDTVYRAPHATDAVKELATEKRVSRSSGRTHDEVVVQLPTEQSLFP
jgi:three-Cys-motif partner protein